jgi:serine-type D-Ala-D-Ala carboxypeptidase/endopeptidase (penicillin-binding protein 4)
MRSKSLTILCFSLLWLAPAAFAQTAASELSVVDTPAKIAQSEPVVCPANLNTTVAAIASRYNLQRHHWGYYVQPLAANNPVASYQGSSLFIPASSNKLLTTAAVLNHLGGQYRLRTSIYQDPNSNLQQPALTIVGRGDPTITNTQIQDLAAQLQQKGIRQISKLTANGGYFRGSPMNPDWEWGDLYTDYGVPTTSLILQQNAVELVVTPQQVGQPPSYRWRTPLAGVPWQIDNRAVTGVARTENSIEVQALQGKPTLLLTGNLPLGGGSTTLNLAMLSPNATWLNQLQFNLAQKQINTSQLQVIDSEPVVLGQEVAAIESPTLENLVKQTNRTSNNLFAEVLLRTLGRSNTEAGNSTAELGLKMVKAKLTALGVNANGYRQADGSGLSRKNLLSPQTLVQTLIGMSKTPEAAIYRDSLPVGGVNGTLANRFKSYPNQIQAKTGTLTGTVALAGYANPAQYQPLAFGILVNNHDRPASEIRSAVDEMATAFLRLRSCP